MKNHNQSMAQYIADAKISYAFEQSSVLGKSFNYSKLITNPPSCVPGDEVTAYLSTIQRGGLIQPFGCVLAIEEPTFKIIAYSENCGSLLGLNCLDDREKGLIGIDARTLFTLSSRAPLERAVSASEIQLLNPIWVHSERSRKPFYAILHRIDVGVLIDFEPARYGNPAMLLAGAMHSHKLIAKASSRLQSLPGGDIGALCDTVVEEVQKLTGYDRVMIYKFHEDEHGEVVSEIRRSDLEPYLGFHYPATDIPQAARFLFKQNRVRIICDCHAIPVRVLQSEELKQNICLVNSTLRWPHGCHAQYMANMGSIASLVMAVVVNDNELFRLWGLVVCHHSSPRYVPFPLRHACELLMQTFGLQLSVELQLLLQSAEKKIIWMQTLLCDMLLRDFPCGIMTQSPSIMDVVRCDGAALYCNGNCWLNGVTPSESEVIDIAEWLLNGHKDLTGLSTECLCESGYPNTASLGDAVCGMAAAKISEMDFLFWFRSRAVDEIKWGGAKHFPGDKDDGERMNPRSSFKVFLEVVKSRSSPWEGYEINAIHSLQMILKESFKKVEENSSKSDFEVKGLEELSLVVCEMGRVIETASAPIFGVSLSGLINGWNGKIAQLTGLLASEALGKSLVNEVAHESSRDFVQRLLHRALNGEEDINVELKLKKFGTHQQNAVVYIDANTCVSRDYVKNVVGVCFIGQDVTSKKFVMDKFIRLQGEYEALLRTINPLVPPIFASDENACCSEWNAAMEKLTGWKKHEVMGKMLPREIFGNFCRMNSQDLVTKFSILLFRAINGHDSMELHFGFFNREGRFTEALLMANKRTDGGGKVIGCLCFLQTEVQHSAGEGQHDRAFVSKLGELAYVRQEIKSPLNGVRVTHKLMEITAISADQKQFLETSDACERQIMLIIGNGDLESVEEGEELNMEEFLVANLLDAIVSQVMIVLQEKHLRLVHEVPDQIRTFSVYGDQIRLQLVLSDFLLNIVHHAPSPDGWVEIKVLPGLKLIQNSKECIHLQFRITHPGCGFPSALVEDMFEEKSSWNTQEGFSLNISRKLLNRMNGHVRYVRDRDECYFLVDIELETRK